METILNGQDRLWNIYKSPKVFLFNSLKKRKVTKVIQSDSILHLFLGNKKELSNIGQFFLGKSSFDVCFFGNPIALSSMIW